MRGGPHASSLHARRPAVVAPAGVRLGGLRVLYGCSEPVKPCGWAPREEPATRRSCKRLRNISAQPNPLTAAPSITCEQRFRQSQARYERAVHSLPENANQLLDEATRPQGNVHQFLEAHREAIREVSEALGAFFSCRDDLERARQALESAKREFEEAKLDQQRSVKELSGWKVLGSQ